MITRLTTVTERFFKGIQVLLCQQIKSIKSCIACVYCVYVMSYLSLPTFFTISTRLPKITTAELFQARNEKQHLKDLWRFRVLFFQPEQSTPHPLLWRLSLWVCNEDYTCVQFRFLALPWSDGNGAAYPNKLNQCEKNLRWKAQNWPTPPKSHP